MTRKQTAADGCGCHSNALPEGSFRSAMILIRRQIDRERAYTAIFLPGEPPRVFPTSDYEHARILQIYKQDRAHPGIENDFSDDPPRLAALPSGVGATTPPPAG
jgi:hypothetical protein